MWILERGNLTMNDIESHRVKCPDPLDLVRAGQDCYNSLKLNPAWHPPFVEGVVVYYL